MTHFSLLADLINLNAALDADRTIDLDQRKQRDRVIGLELQSHRSQPATQIRAWLHRQTSDADRLSGQQGARLYHVLCVILIVAGFIVGWGLASAVLFYDGQQPINIVNALVVLVLPQVFLLFIWVLTALPYRPVVFSSLASVFGFFNPGRLASHLGDVLSRKQKSGLAILWQPEHSAILLPATRWLFSFWSQLFAFSFNIGILVKALFLISFSDLAFVWSTTLSVSEADFHQLLIILSTPWSLFFPDAVPALELIVNSRYYRLDEVMLSEAVTTQQAIILGQWWPFLIAAVCCYGLFPRLLTLVFSWSRFRHHVRNAVSHLPGAPELLARMNSPLVSSQASQPEQALDIVMPTEKEIPATDHYALRCPVIDWSQAGVDKDSINQWLLGLGVEALSFHDAGGRQSLLQDEALAAALCKNKPPGLAILVKAWEPPMLEFLDFVRLIRQACGAQKAIIILLLGEKGIVNELDRDTWQITLAQLSDPDLHIEVAGQVK